MCYRILYSNANYQIQNCKILSHIYLEINGYSTFQWIGKIVSMIFKNYDNHVVKVLFIIQQIINFKKSIL